MSRPLVEHPLTQVARDAAAYAPVEHDEPLDAARGIAVGLAIAAPFWVALAWWLS